MIADAATHCNELAYEKEVTDYIGLAFLKQAGEEKRKTAQPQMMEDDSEIEKQEVECRAWKYF